MDYEEREKLCYRILSGFVIVVINDIIYQIYDPKPIDFYHASYVYEDLYEQSKFDGTINQDIADVILNEKKLVDGDASIQLKILNDNLTLLRKKLPGLEFRSNEKKEVMAYIQHTEKQINRIKSAQSNLLTQTSEYLCKIEKYRHMLFRLTKNKDNQPFWTNWESFNQTNERILSRLLQSSYFDNSITESNMREIARTEPWRSIWIASCKVGNLFPHPMTEMTVYQKNIVSWSLIYDNVYENIEAPSQDIINDDLLLDSWLAEQNDKRKTKEVSKNIKTIDAQEVGIVCDTQEDANKVYSLNDPNTLSIIKNRETLLRTKESVKEQNLPDIRRSLQIQMNNANSEKIRKG